MPSLFDPTQRAGARVLLERLGVLDTIRVGAAVATAERRGEPFQHLDPAETDRERLSREQIGPAILLYRELLNIRPEAEARDIVEHVVTEAAVVFLRATIGSLNRSDLEGLSDTEREEFARSRGEKFFNATVRWDAIEADQVKFTVVHCRFPELCALVGHPELAPVFCAGDARFFGTVEKDVELIRPGMIATGHDCCPFTIRFAERDDA